jgi:hypothetical protein
MAKFLAGLLAGDVNMFDESAEAQRKQKQEEDQKTL